MGNWEVIAGKQMIDWGSGLLESLTWRNVLIGTLIFAVTVTINLAIVSLILVKLPADYFHETRTGDFWKRQPPPIRILGVIGKNVLGLLLVAIGVLLSLPGVPGQGVLTILLGIMLLDFPGRRRLERYLVSRPKVFHAINKLRHRFGKPQLILD